MRRADTNPNAERGGAAVAVLVALVLLQLAVVGVVVSGGRETTLTARRLETVRSFYAAEAGVNMAIRELSVGADEDADGGIGSISDDSDDSTDPLLAGARVRVEMTDESDGSTLLASIGRQGDATRRIEASLAGGGGGAGGMGSGPAVVAGLAASWFYESSTIQQLNDIDWSSTPDVMTVEADIDWNNSGWPRDSYLGLELNGWVDVPAGGTWTFSLASDDGSALWINGVEVVNNDGLHSVRTRSGTADLAAGRHAIRVRFFENTGAAVLILGWSGPGQSYQTVPEGVLWH